jgi:hypothetical protein
MRRLAPLALVTLCLALCACSRADKATRQRVTDELASVRSQVEAEKAARKAAVDAYTPAADVATDCPEGVYTLNSGHVIDNYTAYATVALPEALEDLKEETARGYRERNVTSTLDIYEELVAGEDFTKKAAAAIEEELEKMRSKEHPFPYELVFVIQGVVEPRLVGPDSYEGGTYEGKVMVYDQVQQKVVCGARHNGTFIKDAFARADATGTDAELDLLIGLLSDARFSSPKSLGIDTPPAI